MTSALHAGRQAWTGGDPGARPRDLSARVLRRAAAAATGVVVEACPLPNTTEEGPRRRFLVRPQRLPGRGSARGATRGLELLGFYHSHPDHPAQPSQYDLDHAWPFSYVIVSVRGREPLRTHVVAACARIDRRLTKSVRSNPPHRPSRLRMHRSENHMATRFSSRRRSGRSPTSSTPSRSTGRRSASCSRT